MFFGWVFGVVVCFIFACVARARPSSQHRKTMKRFWFLWATSHSRVFHALREGHGIEGSGGSDIDRIMPPKAREAKNTAPGQASGGQKKPKARKKAPGPAEQRPKSVLVECARSVRPVLAGYGQARARINRSKHAKNVGPRRVPNGHHTTQDSNRLRETSPN